ncbi:MAG TPA: hypothetical protein VMD08_09330 [Candidatus Baltobacteraceae bacterium]|nr:hypothetical protein [Candidatus Baltobacteraceae bacterium]
MSSTESPDARAPLASTAVLEGARIRVEARVEAGQLRERYLARRDGKWVPVADSSADRSVGPCAVAGAGGQLLRGTVGRVSVAGGTLTEELLVDGLAITRTVRCLDDGPWLHVVTRMVPGREVSIASFGDQFRFLAPADWTFSPSVGGFNPDAQYKAPLVLVQSGRSAVGIVPDLARLERDVLARCPHTLDLDVPAGPLLTVGFVPARLASHSVYAPATGCTWALPTQLVNAYYLLVTADADPGSAFREAVRAHWAWFGRREQAGAAPQQAATDARYRGAALWDDWRRVVWGEETARLWLDVPLPDGTTGGAVRTDRWGPGPAAYLTSWFNAMRTAFGMALHSRREGNDALLQLAGRTVALALQAPGREGAFKTIAAPGREGANPLWAAGDGCGAGTEEGFLGYDMSWTAYWLLRWRAAGLPGSAAIVPRCEALAEFLVARQMPDGMLPTQFNEDGSVRLDRAVATKAETGPVVLFLLELYAQDSNPAWLAAARRGFAFLEEAVVPQRQWYDYETFWSCSPREPVFDARTAQWPANNLALGQTVAAYLAMGRVTGERSWLDRGRHLLDYLLLYQQCWTHPGLDPEVAPPLLLGGFTTQNSDAEWSDARQSFFGNLLLDYYRATAEIEYLERGVAALRAQFPVSPAENWAHTGYGGKGAVTSFHWGTGSGMAGIEIEEEYLRDAIVDVAAARGVGVNGLDLTECAVEEDQIRFRLCSPFRWRRRPVVVFRQATPERVYQLTVNGEIIGSWNGRALAAGIPLNRNLPPTTSPTLGADRI